MIRGIIMFIWISLAIWLMTDPEILRECYWNNEINCT